MHLKETLKQFLILKSEGIKATVLLNKPGEETLELYNTFHKNNEKNNVY